MENGKASVTAVVTAFGRAYHSLYENPKIFNDFLAPNMLLDQQFQDISKHMTQGVSFFYPEEAINLINNGIALQWVIQNQIAPTPLSRSRYTEDMLENALLLGVKQYVILGAGLDTFAFRNPHLLTKINVYEVDHPDTQALKKNRINDLKWEVPSQLKFVPVDFTKDNFADEILKTDYRKDKLSFFSWLGVTYYLTRDEILKNLKDIARISPKGSSLVFDYADENFFNPDTPRRVRNTIALANNSGEPMKSAYSYQELEKDLEEAGFLIYEHLTPKEIENMYFKGRLDDYHAFENTNFVLAVVK